jgi:hypothetical protein
MLGGFGVIEVLVCCSAAMILVITALAIFGVLWFTQERMKRGGG